MALEFLRRAGKEYDRYLISQYTRSLAHAGSDATSSSSDAAVAKNGSNATTHSAVPAKRTFRPNVLQQALRALLHMLQFAVAYFIMLLAMYYNGYIIICTSIFSIMYSVKKNLESEVLEQLTRLTYLFSSSRYLHRRLYRILRFRMGVVQPIAGWKGPTAGRGDGMLWLGVQ